MDAEWVCRLSHERAQSSIPQIGRLEQALYDVVDRIRDSERMIEQSRAMLEWFGKHVR
jgi:hypothetical protein